MIRKKLSNFVDTVRSGLISVVVLALFLFPLFVGFTWVKGVIASRDTRVVFSESDLNSHCSNNSHQNVKPFEQPLLTVTFDDGWESAYSSALPTLEEHCIDTTQYILGNHFSEKDYLSEDQVFSFQKFGHEIASHTMTHPNLTTLSESNLFWELDQSKYELTNRFGEIKDFASPLGASNPDVIGQIKSLYRSHRNTASDPATIGVEDVNTKENFDQYNIIAYAIRRDTPDEYISNLINYAKKHNYWVVLCYHQVDYSDLEFSVKPENFKRHMKIIADSGIKTPVMSDVLDAIEDKRGN